MRTRTTTPKRAGPKPLTRPKAALKFCPGGHMQSMKWRPGDDCWQCDRAEKEAKEKALLGNDPHAAFRAEKLAELGPVPDVMTLRPRSGGPVQTFSARPQRRRR